MRNYTKIQNAICFASKQLNQRFGNGSVERVVASLRLYLSGRRYSWSALCQGSSDLLGCLGGITARLEHHLAMAWADTPTTRLRSMPGRPLPPDFS